MSFKQKKLCYIFFITSRGVTGSESRKIPRNYLKQKNRERDNEMRKKGKRERGRKFKNKKEKDGIPNRNSGNGKKALAGHGTPF